MVRPILRLLALAGLALAPGACRDKNEGAPSVMVIGGDPKVSDPAAGPLTAPDAVEVDAGTRGSHPARNSFSRASDS